MIHYDLVCATGHVFDGWFRDSSSYDRQHKRGAVTCPTCGTSDVRKQLMAPGIVLRGGTPAPAEPSATPSAPDAAQQRVFAGPLDPRQQMLLRMMRELKKHVEENAEYVGDKFAEEARRIHYEESEQRGIYGEATADEAKSLLEEGIEVHPLPRLPEEGN
jgi:hypothetical protein